MLGRDQAQYDIDICVQQPYGEIMAGGPTQSLPPRNRSKARPTTTTCPCRRDLGVDDDQQATLERINNSMISIHPCRVLRR